MGKSFSEDMGLELHHEIRQLAHKGMGCHWPSRACPCWVHRQGLWKLAASLLSSLLDTCGLIAPSIGGS